MIQMIGSFKNFAKKIDTFTLYKIVSDPEIVYLRVDPSEFKLKLL